MSMKINSATLLTVEEAEQLLTKEERKYNKCWWLRSPGVNQKYAMNIFYDGTTCNACVNDDDIYVRPALNITFDSSEHNIGDVFDFGDKKFKIISNHLAICLDDIGQSLFREDFYIKNSNDYEFSDVRKFVDEWFKKSKSIERVKSTNIEFISSNIKINSATLLTDQQAKTLLTQEEREYENWWWLRIPNNDPCTVAIVGKDGLISYCDYNKLDEYGIVRPVLNIEAPKDEVGSMFRFGDIYFKILSENLAFCMQDIGNALFKENLSDENVYVYETSDIKEFIDNWFEEAKAKEEKGKAYKIVFDDMINSGCGLFVGRYDGKNGNPHFMYGIGTIMEWIARQISAEQFIEFSNMFYKNMEKSEEGK